MNAILLSQEYKMSGNESQKTRSWGSKNHKGLVGGLPMWEKMLGEQMLGAAMGGQSG